VVEWGLGTGGCIGGRWRRHGQVTVEDTKRGMEHYSIYGSHD
jgi:hypothetical protein